MSDVIQQTGGLTMITTTTKPLTQLQSRGDFTFEDQDDGTVLATESYTCDAALWLQLKPVPRLSRHQLYPWCIVKKSRYEQSRRGGQGIYFITFIVGLTQDKLPPPEVEFDTDTEELELDTHPAFVSEIGGSLGNERNGAVFDEDTYEWRGFRAAFDDGTPNPWFGVKSWKARFQVIRETVHTFGGVGSEATGRVVQHAQYGRVFYSHYNARYVGDNVTQTREYIVLSGNINEIVINAIYGQKVFV